MTSRVAVAMSGGVDSTVAALLLRRKGHQLVGVFMRNWDERDETGHCSAEADYHEVQALCGHIGIPCRQVDFVREYWNEVFNELLQGYESGGTPNPDILCNRRIKFRAFREYVLNSLGMDAMATGHYARVLRSYAGTKLLQSVDRFKDQTFFLAQISQSALQQTLFPIGHLTKQEVKKIAVEAGLERTANRKESMGLCFVGKREFPKLINEYLEEKPGFFINLDGKVVGEHKGHHFFTIGQRARVGGQPAPYFVANKDSRSNTVTVAQGSEHPALYCLSFTTTPPHWISGKPPEELVRGQQMQCDMRYRHQQPLIRCTLEVLGADSEHLERSSLAVRCDQPLRAVCPGQYAVFYSEDECLGSACITEAGHSLWQQQSEIQTCQQRNPDMIAATNS